VFGVVPEVDIQLANHSVMSIVGDGRLGAVVVRYRRSGQDALVESVLDRVPVSELLVADPVREFRWFKGRTFYSGWYWSATTGGMVVYESLLELARILMADFDADIERIVAQPFQMEGDVGGVLRRHVPDLLLGYRDGQVTVVDVKPASRLADPRVGAVFDWTARAAAHRGWRFEVWSGADAVLLANIRFLAGYRRPFTVDVGLCTPVLEIAAGQETLGGLERAARGLAPRELVRPVVLHLLWSRRLGTDLRAPLGEASAVWQVAS
jgi:hypothetical protein